MKALFKPLSNIFGKKSSQSSPEEDSSDSAEQQPPPLKMDDDLLAKRYCDTVSATTVVQTKLDKLLETKEHIAEDRFSSLHEQYRTFLDKHKPGLTKLSDEIDRRIESYIEEKKDAAERFTEIKKAIQQEARLLEVGVISKEEYLDKIQSFKPEEKMYKEKYKISQELITILKDAKNNKYTPAEPRTDTDPESNEQRSSKNSPQKSADKNYYEMYRGKDVNIKIDCGANLAVKIDGIAIPITANFVGSQKHEYILINHPAPYTTVKPKLFTGNKLMIECLFDGKLFIFSSAIVENMTKPIRAVVLEYPKELTVKMIRASSRVTCRIPSTLIFKGSGKEAIISDISPKGCRLEAIYQPTERNYIARTNDIVSVQCAFSGDVEVYNVSGIIRNAKKKQSTLLYGIQFTEVTEAVQKAILKHLSTLNHECFNR